MLVKIACFLFGMMTMFVLIMVFVCCAVAGNGRDLNRPPSKEEWKAGKRQRPWM